jgi:release factor glutamine methyltransferase
LFDLLLFNAPYLPSEDCKEITWLERAWAGGVMGRRVIDEFISGVDDHISKGGRVLLMQSTLSNVEETVSKMERKELATKVKKSIDVGFFETIVLIEAIHN